MSDTKEKILHESLRLFARDGYEAVSCSDIAGVLGITKGALYRHYKSKRDIFGSILTEMERRDAVRAAAFDLPEGTLSDMPEKYRDVVVLRLYAELPFSEVAEVLHISENSAKVIFHRAKKLLSEELKHEHIL